jgi:peptidoglycan/xylan/chitin deacetylase (PgdA/CDA1 family)
MNDPAAALKRDAVAVFLFHGVIRTARTGIRNYTGKHLALDEFARILTSLESAGSPVSMPEVASFCSGETTLPDYAFAVTFDDGFENNASVAAPALEEFRIPATFYVTTGFIDENGSSWIDLIEQAVEEVDSFSLILPFRQPHATYRTRDEKIALLDEIRKHAKLDSSIDPYELAGDVRAQLGVQDLEPDVDLDRKLSWAQIDELAQHELFTVGGHGLTHRILSHLGDEALEHEIAVGLGRLREEISVPVDQFSYPEGLAHCYSDRVIECIARHGITCAVTAEPEVVRPGTDAFRIGRFLVA